MNLRNNKYLFLGILFSSVFTIQSQASNKAPHVVQAQTEDLAEVWVIKLPFEQSAAFENAFSQYANLRSQAGDISPWQLYKTQISSDMDGYLIRHCCFKSVNRADFEFWLRDNNIYQVWDDTLGKHISSYEHFYSNVEAKHLLVAADEGDQDYVTVAEFSLNQGAAVKAAIQEVKTSTQEADFGENWAWAFAQPGKTVLNFNYSFEYESDEHSQNKAQDVSLNKQQKVRDELANLSYKYDGNVSDSLYQVYQYQPQLSIK